MKVKKMRFGMKFAVIALTSAFLVSSFPAQSSAYVKLGGKWSNAKSLTYWLDSTVASTGFTSASIMGEWLGTTPHTCKSAKPTALQERILNFLVVQPILGMFMQTL